MFVRRKSSLTAFVVMALFAVAIFISGVGAQEQTASPALTFEKDNVILFAPARIAGLRVNGQDVEFTSVFPSVIETTIEGNESGYSCTNDYQVVFANGEEGKLTANHCHGTTVFSVIPGRNLEDLEYHDAQEDAGTVDDLVVQERYKWYFESTELPTLMLSVPQTDDLILFAACLPATKQIKAQILMFPEFMEEGEQVQLTYKIDDSLSSTHAIDLETWPYEGGGLVPTLYTSSYHPFYEQLSGGNILDISINKEVRALFSLAGSAAQINPFISACRSLEN